MSLARVRGLGVRGKMLSAFAAVFIGVIILGMSLLTLGSSMNSAVDSVGNTYSPAVQSIGDLHLAVAEVQRDQFAYLAAPDAAEQAAAAAAIAQHIGEAKDALATLDGFTLTDAQRHLGDLAQASWVQYQSQTASIGTTTDSAAMVAAVALISTGDAAATMDTLDGQLDDWTASLTAASDAATSQSASQASLLIPLVLGGIALIILIGSALSLFLSRSISRRLGRLRDQLGRLASGVTDITACFEALARNDLTASYTGDIPLLGDLGTDEIGQAASASTDLHMGLKSMVGAYETARVNLTGTIGEVKIAAESVSRTSIDLNSAATQSGSASTQIAQTINQVASGASEQARAASDTADASVQLGAAITQVGSGAAETSRKVETASIALHEMATAISGASAASTEVTGVAGRAAAAADNGREAVRQTVTEMDRIKRTVEDASQKVTELGAKSDQIGAIVETIDDIAEQTNLLALNAAIEAARAGEQGKGFAVVADEVRKLAERSSRATKEIAALIGEVQKGTTQAVEAMRAGAAVVEEGSTLANQAGRSLDEIADAVAATKAAVVRITSAVADMGAASNGVMAASDDIARIASQTNTAASAMTSSADTVSRSVQAIAAISEENSASAEEVSAATEEMSAQAEEVVASAESLATMASELESLVAGFKVGSADGDRTARQSMRSISNGTTHREFGSRAA
jgi:methyl-accepting chemotaxis protein